MKSEEHLKNKISGIQQIETDRVGWMICKSANKR